MPSRLSLTSGSDCTPAAIAVVPFHFSYRCSRNKKATNGAFYGGAHTVPMPRLFRRHLGRGVHDEPLRAVVSYGRLEVREMRRPKEYGPKRVQVNLSMGNDTFGANL